MTATLKRFLDSRLVRWLLSPERLPLYFATMVVTAIMYHYFAAATPLWAIASLLLELLLFKLFRYVEKHHLLGGIFFCAAGIGTLMLSLLLMYIGENPELTNGVFMYKQNMPEIDYYIWFLTPQTVLNAVYLPYTIATFFLFTFFVGFATYYFTIVRYRILMTFAILSFPFAIYAKEAEVMPVLCIILLFACYFAVMIFCRQLHSENPEIVQQYSPDSLSCVSEEFSEKSLLVHPRPEISDRAGWRTGALFLCGACIIVLLLPKPTVHENRSYIEGMINFASFTDALLEAISGFESESDGGASFSGSSSQTLYYATADKPENLRRATFTIYHYDTDSWETAYFDEKNAGGFYPDYETALTPYSEATRPFKTSAYPISVYDIYLLLRSISEQNPELAEQYGFSELAGTDLKPDAHLHELGIIAAGYNGDVYLSPNHTFSIQSYRNIQQNATGVFYRDNPPRVFREQFTLQYLSDTIAQEEIVGYMMENRTFSDWYDTILALNASELPPDITEQIWNVFLNLSYADQLNLYCYLNQEIPERVQELADTLTEGCTSDYEKAVKIRDYLAHGEYIYDLDYIKAADANVETFLFESKTGVCYEFASAMVLLCRAAGIPARYVEGYSMSEPSNSERFDFLIKTNHGHAFADVYIAGYGWMSMDATAPDYLTSSPAAVENVIRTLQIAGFILLAAALLLLLMLKWIIPYFSEKAFCRWYRTQNNAQAVERAFARLRTEWKADPAVTARCLCDEMEQTLGCDTKPMRKGIEEAVYSADCSEETAKEAYECYRALRKAYKERNRRKKPE